MQGLCHGHPLTVPVHNVAFVTKMNTLFIKDLTHISLVGSRNHHDVSSTGQKWMTGKLTAALSWSWLLLPCVPHLLGMAATGWHRRMARAEKWVGPGWLFVMKWLTDDWSLVLSSHSHLSAKTQQKAANLKLDLAAQKGTYVQDKQWLHRRRHTQRKPVSGPNPGCRTSQDRAP